AQSRRHGIHLPVHRPRAEVERLTVHRGGGGSDATPGLPWRCHHRPDGVRHHRQRVVARLHRRQFGDAEHNPSLKRQLPTPR
ncbi:MAG: hypothetical protein ACK56I_34060, partial [bacterium]